MQRKDRKRKIAPLRNKPVFSGGFRTSANADGVTPDPKSADTDGDGLPDGWEVGNGLDPLSADGADGADGDPDGDGLCNRAERIRGTGPRNADTDGDGLSDGREVELGLNPKSPDTDGDGLTDGREVELGLDPKSSDTDGDGLSDGLEASLGLNPLQPDTDGDCMDDGWEHRHRSAGFDPAVDGADDGNPDNDSGADPDGDGLTNGQECEWRTDPSNADTDGDGVGDGAEVAQGSDPTDGSDGGRPGARVPVPFHFGDPSGSHSEKYRLDVTPVSGPGGTPASFSWLNGNYGECETRTAMLKPGWRYEVRLRWAACSHTHDGSYYPNYDYTLRLDGDVPACVGLDDPGSIFRSNYYGSEYYGSEHFPVLDSAATVTVYAVTGVAVCSPDDPSWAELEESRVLLDDEDLRIRVAITPAVDSFDLCSRAFGSNLLVSTSGTCPASAAIPLSESDFLQFGDHSEIRVSRTRAQLAELGLLPSKDDDGVDEMAWMDMADLSPGTGQDLSDSEAFAEIALEDRGRACGNASLTLESTPPNSAPSESYFKAAGREVVRAEYGGVASRKRQVMNQADVFYFSGHGAHGSGDLQGRFTPSMAKGWWDRDLDVAILAGCSVLDVNDCNGNYSDPVEHAMSPGKKWEDAGPGILLGYAYSAPGDAGGAPARIARSWAASRASLGDVEAWMKANEDNHAWNACAIVKGEKYVYFRRHLKYIRVKKSILKENW